MTMFSQPPFSCFPDDIWTQITPALLKQDVASLCLTCKHLAELLQHRLFDSIVLSSRERAEGLLDIAQHKPQLLSQTSLLVLWDQRYGVHKSAELLQWLQSADAGCALQHLPRLDTLELDALIFSSLESTHGIRSIAEHVFIQTLRLTRCKFPLTAAAFTVMEMFTKLSSVEFTNTIIGPPPGNGITAIKQTVRPPPIKGGHDLVSFKVLENPGSLPSFPFDSLSTWMIASGRVESLRSIRIAITEWVELQQLVDLFRNATSTLDHLHIDLKILDLTRLWDVHEFIPPLLPIESLKSVVMSGMKQQMTSKIASFLQSIMPTTHNINTLRLVVADDRVVLIHRRESPMRLLDSWRLLDQAATRADEVTLSFLLPQVRIKSGVPDAIDVGTTLFPETTARGGLRVDIFAPYI